MLVIGYVQVCFKHKYLFVNVLCFYLFEYDVVFFASDEIIDEVIFYNQDKFNAIFGNILKEVLGINLIETLYLQNLK